MIAQGTVSALPPFNGPVEIGLRALAVLAEVFPAGYSLQRLVVLDYLVVHSDDLPGGPQGLHPKTPHRGGELLVRRAVLEQGLLLYQSRGLVERRYTEGGLMFAATERTAAFLDALNTTYVKHMRARAEWLASELGELNDDFILRLAREHVGEWGAEFAMESVLKMEDEVWP